jgi:hypothetical protein
MIGFDTIILCHKAHYLIKPQPLAMSVQKEEKYLQKKKTPVGNILLRKSVVIK